MGRLTLYVPGLWPPRAGELGMHPLRLQAPVLQRMLVRGDCLPCAPLGFEASLARLFGEEDEHLPWAALGLWGEHGQRPEGHVLRLDPVHLELGMHDAIVFAGPSLQLSMAQAQALAQTIEAHFHDLCWRLEVAAPERWYLHTPQAFALLTTPLTCAIGRDAGLFKPGGADGRRWLAWLTQVQMLLHAHPVNLAREARGLAPINHVWPWGQAAPAAGQGDAPLPVVLAKGEGWHIVYASHPLARGLALAAGLPLAHVPASFAELPRPAAGEHALVVLDDALWPWLAGDAKAWQASIEAMERRWFAPLWHSLGAGEIEALVLECAGQQRWILKPGHRWRVWRRRGEGCACVPSV